MEERISEVECHLIRVSPFQPRRIFAEEELDELAASIKAVGLIHPPVVREIVSGGKILYYELIAGERRWRACIKSGFSKIKVLVRPSTDEEAAKATLIENVQRVDLDPIEMAEAFKKLVDVFKMTQEEVSEKVGKKRSTVANYLRLLSLPKPMQEALSGGSITMGHAKALLSLNTPELQKQLHDLILKKEMTVRDAERESQKLGKKIKHKVSPKSPDIHIVDLEEQLQDALGTKVGINPISQKEGTITIHYYGLEDLERLVDLLRTRT